MSQSHICKSHELFLEDLSTVIEHLRSIHGLHTARGQKFIDRPALGKSDSHGIFEIAMDAAKSGVKTIEVSDRTRLCGIIFVLATILLWTISSNWTCETLPFVKSLCMSKVEWKFDEEGSRGNVKF